MSEAKQHAILSPSGAAGWMACAGKAAMEKGLPDGSNEYSDEGTAAHTVAAMCLLESKDPAAFKGRRIAVDTFRTVEVTDDMADGVRIYVDAVRERVESYKLAGAVSVELMVEQQVPIGHITGEAGAEGTADVVIIALLADGITLLDVWDLKFGRGIMVQAEGNPQGQMYALGALEKFSAVTEFNRVRINIHQPRLAQAPSDWEITVEELQKFASHAKERAFHALQVYRTEHPGAYIHHLNAGDHCRKTFCKARATCPKLAAFVKDSVGAEFEVLAEVPEKGAEPAALLTSLIPAEPMDLANKMAAIELIEDWCKAIRGKVESVLLAGGEVPGYKVVQGKQGNRAWTSKEEAEALLKSMRLRQEEMYDFSLISPTQAEKVLKDTPKRWKRVEPFITRAPGKPSVAPVSDKRPALTITPVADDFAQLTGAEDLV